MCMHMPTKQSIFWPYNKSAFSILCVLMKACSLANAKHKAKRLDDFKFRTFIGPSQVTWQGKTNKSAKFEIAHSADYTLVTLLGAQVQVSAAMSASHKSLTSI